MNGRPHAQLPLAFDHRPSVAGEDFLVAPCNADAVAWLDRWPDWPSTALVVHGPVGCGKSHLAEVFMVSAAARKLTARDLRQIDPPSLLAGVPACIVEDADDMIEESLEPALLHLHNMAAETGQHLLLTAMTPPAHWKMTLADLRSRLNTAITIGIGPPDDDLIGAVMVKQFADRQLKVADDVVPFMLPRMERSFAAVSRLVAAIDGVALAERRNITVPLVRQVLSYIETA